MADSPLDHHDAPPAKAAKGDKRRQQLLIGGTIALVLIAYLTYRKMKSGSGGGTVSSTGTPAGVVMPPAATGTNVPSGQAAPQTTVPFAAPTDTTGGGSIPVTSGTPVVGAPSSTMPTQVAATPAAGPATGTPAAQAQSVTPTPHPAGSPALTAPLATPHPTGSSLGSAAPITSSPHPATVAGR